MELVSDAAPCSSPDMNIAQLPFPSAFSGGEGVRLALGRRRCRAAYLKKAKGGISGVVVGLLGTSSSLRLTMAEDTGHRDVEGVSSFLVYPAGIAGTWGTG